jgi:hypothetical protein
MTKVEYAAKVGNLWHIVSPYTEEVVGFAWWTSTRPWGRRVLVVRRDTGDYVRGLGGFPSLEDAVSALFSELGVDPLKHYWPTHLRQLIAKICKEHWEDAEDLLLEIWKQVKEEFGGATAREILDDIRDVPEGPYEDILDMLLEDWLAKQGEPYTWNLHETRP